MPICLISFQWSFECLDLLMSFNLSCIVVTFVFLFLFVSFQYYEMSYGLNVEMHKQVSESICDATAK